MLLFVRGAGHHVSNEDAIHNRKASLVQRAKGGVACQLAQGFIPVLFYFRLSKSDDGYLTHFRIWYKMITLFNYSRWLSQSLSGLRNSSEKRNFGIIYKDMEEPMQIIDITLPLSNRIPVWSDDVGITTRLTSTIAAGGEANVTEIQMSVHTGTHLDAPRHFLNDRIGIDQLDLHTLVGAVKVVDIPAEVQTITCEVVNLRCLKEISSAFYCERATAPAGCSSSPNFRLTLLPSIQVEQRRSSPAGCVLSGSDYLSVASYSQTREVHELLLGADVILLEGANLADVKAGDYQMVCLPLLLPGSDGAPARVILTRD